MNKVVLIGRLTKDLELRKTQSNKSTVQFNIAINRRFNKEETDFISCIAWNQSAEYLCNYAKKGDLIGLSGSIQTRNYESQNGKVYVTEAVCDEVNILNSKRKEENEQQFEADLPKTKKYGVEIGDEYIEDKDLPFY